MSDAVENEWAVASDAPTEEKSGGSRKSGVSREQASLRDATYRIEDSVG